MANLTWITKIFNAASFPIKFVDGENTSRQGVIQPGKGEKYEGSGFCFPWADLNKDEKWKPIRFYHAQTGAFLFLIYQSWPSERIRWCNQDNVNESMCVDVKDAPETGGRKAIVVDDLPPGTAWPRVLNQYPDYGKCQVWTANPMNFTFREYYLNSPGDTTLNGPAVYAMLTQMHGRLQYPGGPTFLEGGGPFRGYTIEAWHETVARYTMDERDWGVEYAAGLTGGNLTRLNCPQYANASVVSHEFGHRYQNACNTNSPAGQRLKLEYARLRGADFTSRTNDAERFAEDIRFFFGADGVAGAVASNDDSNFPQVDGKKIRHPAAVPGLRQFLRGTWPVYYYLNARAFASFSYNESSFEFQWFANNRWERFVEGRFIFFDGKNWHPIPA